MARGRARARSPEEDDEEAAPDDADLEDGRMPFIEHLRELRVRVRAAAI